MSSLAEELGRKSDDASRQQEEITHLLSQIVDLQKKAKSVRTHTVTRVCSNSSSAGRECPWAAVKRKEYGIITMLLLCVSVCVGVCVCVCVVCLLCVCCVLCLVCCGERGADTAPRSCQRRPEATHCWGTDKKTVCRCQTLTLYYAEGSAVAIVFGVSDFPQKRTCLYLVWLVWLQLSMTIVTCMLLCICTFGNACIFFYISERIFVKIWWGKFSFFIYFGSFFYLINSDRDTVCFGINY